MPAFHNNPYDRYANPQLPTEPDPYQHYGYTGTGKTYNKPAQDDTNYGYNTPYTPTQYAGQQLDQQIYSNPYYSVSHGNPTGVSDSQNVMSYAGNNTTNTVNQYATYNDPYTQNVHSAPTSQIAPIQEAPTSQPTYSVASQSDLNVNFAQMHLNTPKTTPNYGVDYSQNYYNVQYPESSTTNSVSYAPNSHANVPVTQPNTEHPSMSYPYNNEAAQYGHSNPVYSSSEPQYSYAASSMAHTSQSYPVDTKASEANIAPSTAYATDNQTYNPSLAQLDSLDQPIKSHVTGQALTSNINYAPYQNYDANVSAYSGTSEQNYQPTNTYTDADQNNTNYPQNYQNHPGYMFNTATGNYDYNYGSQNSYNNTNVEQQMTGKEGNWVGQLYTSAGACETVQSPSETLPASAEMTPGQPANDQVYYNSPYGYLTGTNQPNTVVPNEEPQQTNYGANVNQSTYMQSGQGHDTSVTYTNNQGKRWIYNIHVTIISLINAFET